MTVNSRIIRTFLAWSPDAVDVPLMNGLRVQILQTMADLPKARKAQFAAFIQQNSLLVVWDDNVKNILNRARQIESELMEMVWQAQDPQMMTEPEKKGPEVVAEEIEENGNALTDQRPSNMLHTIMVSITMTLITVLLGLGFRAVITEHKIDGGYLRMLLLLMTPVQVFFSLVSRPACMSC